MFHGRSRRYPFKDHCTPPLESMAAFANDAKRWIETDPLNVVSLHCKAGKGRAGLMSCVLMFRTGFAASATEAMDKYDVLRTHNNRGLTVTSQRKFVIFYETLWRQYWCVSGDVGKIPSEDPSAAGADGCKYQVPKQPALLVSQVTLLGKNVATLGDLKFSVFVGQSAISKMQHPPSSYYITACYHYHYHPWAVTVVTPSSSLSLTK